MFFTENRLIEVAETFVRGGGKHLYLDEVHKYPDWSIELKNLYDLYPQLQIVFTGSSMLELQSGNADLSRRAIIRHLQGLSFRQYLALRYQKNLPKLTLENILTSSNKIITDLEPDFQPYQYFEKYLRHGYYPFFMEGEEWYYDKLNATIRAVLESDLVRIRRIDVHNIRKLLRLLYVIAASPPFKPNIQRLSERTGIARNTVLQYLHYLEDSDVLSLLSHSGKGLSVLQKPEKIFLENSNLLFAMQVPKPLVGSVRETFVYNQLKLNHKVEAAKRGDFLVDRVYTFEVGGKSKDVHQVQGIENAYIIADNIDFASGNKIPIWLLGLLY